MLQVQFKMNQKNYKQLEHHMHGFIEQVMDM